MNMEQVPGQPGVVAGDAAHRWCFGERMHGMSGTTVQVCVCKTMSALRIGLHP